MPPREDDFEGLGYYQPSLRKQGPEPVHSRTIRPLRPIQPQVLPSSSLEASSSLPSTVNEQWRKPIYFWESLADQFGEDSDIYKGWNALKTINGPGWQDPNGKTWMDRFVVKGYYVDSNKEPHAIVQIPLGSGKVSSGYTDLNLARPMKEHDLKAWALDRGYFNSPDFIPVNERGEQWLRNDAPDTQRLAAYSRINDIVQDRTGQTTSNPYALSNNAGAVAFRNSGDMLHYRVGDNGHLEFSDVGSDAVGDTTALPSGFMGRYMEGLEEAYPSQPEVRAQGGRIRTRVPRRNSFGDRISRVENLETNDYEVYF